VFFNKIHQRHSNFYFNPELRLKKVNSAHINILNLLRAEEKDPTHISILL